MQELALAVAWHRTNRDSTTGQTSSIGGNTISMQAEMLINAMQNQEDRLLQFRERQADASASNTNTRIIFGTFAAFILLGSSFWLLQREVLQRRRADTALLQASTELAARAAQLEVANKELESFSYSISHDYVFRYVQCRATPACCRKTMSRF